MRKPVSRALIAIGLVVAAVLSLGACTTSSGLGGPDPVLHGQWELASARDAAGRLDLVNQRISLTIGRDSSSEGRSSCSDYTAQVLGTPAALWIRTSFPQYPKCGNQAQQDLEQRYASALAAVRSATTTRTTLTLTAPQVDLRFRRATVAPTAEFVNRSWTLTSVSSIPYSTSVPPGTKVFSATAPDAQSLPSGGPQGTTIIAVASAGAGDQNASLRFSSGGAFSGSTGCRLFAGRYAQDAGEVVVNQLGAIGNSGCDPAGTAIDDYMMNVISSGFTFTPRHGTLALTSDRAEIILNFRETK